MKTRYSVERPCKGADGVPLGRIGCLASDYREKGYREIKLLTSTSSAELIKYAKKKKLPLETELSRCLAELGDDVPASARLTVTPRTLVKQLADAVAACHKKILQKIVEQSGDDTAAQLESLVADEYVERDAFSSPTRRAEELEQLLYSLRGSTVSDAFRTAIEIAYSDVDE